MYKQNDTIKALRGMVFFVELGDDSDNKGGTLMKKCRPCVITSIDEDYNEINPRRYTVVPVSSREEPVIFSKTEVLFQSLNGYSVAVADSVTSVSTYDLKSYTYSIPTSLMKKIDNAVKVHLGYEPYSILEYDPATLVDFKEYKYGIDDTTPSLMSLLENTRAANNLKVLPTPVLTKSPGNNNDTTNNSKTIVVYKKLNQADLRALKNKGLKNWTVEDCVSFMRAFNEFSNAEMAKIFSVKLASIYPYKAAAVKKLDLAGVSLIHSKIAATC